MNRFFAVAPIASGGWGRASARPQLFAVGCSLRSTPVTRRVRLRRPLLFVMGALLLCCTSCRTEPDQLSDEGATEETASTQPARQVVAPMFREVSSEVGIDFVHVTGRPGTHFLPEVMIGGGAFLDYDQDGDLDIYLVTGNYDYDGQQGPGPHPVANRLYRQEPNGSFVDVTDASGLGDTGYGMGAAAGDINNDGYPDVYVTNYGPDKLFLNRGDGTFADITQEAGIDNPQWGGAAGFVDYDRDGWLDLYVANYVEYIPTHACFANDGRPDYCNPGTFRGIPDLLYHNVTGKQPAGFRGAKFENVSDASAISRRRRPGDGIRTTDQRAAAAAGAYSAGAGLGIAIADANGDDWPDIFVANDTNANYLWINNQDGTFRDEAIPLGCAFDTQGRSQANMGIAVDDVDGNGSPDYFVTHLSDETNALYLNEREAGFQDSSADSGLGATSYDFTGFGTAFADVEHDGDLDLFVVNGRVILPRKTPHYPGMRPVGGLTDFWTIYAEPKLLFLNDGSGQFTSVSSPEDDFLTTLSVSRGLCAGDVDNDGDMDFLVINAASQAELFRNVGEKKGSWLMIRAVEPALGGRDAYGALITVKAVGKSWTRSVQACASYCSSHDPRVHFGLGPAQDVEQIEVRWPAGDRELFPGGPANRLVVLKHGEGKSS